MPLQAAILSGANFSHKGTVGWTLYFESYEDAVECEIDLVNALCVGSGILNVNAHGSDEMTDLAQFSVLTALIIGGFGLFAFRFIRLERHLDHLIDRLEGEFKNLRRDLAEEFRAQRAEVAQQITAITNAIIASRKD